MAAFRTTPGFFFARGFLGVCRMQGLLMFAVGFLLLVVAVDIQRGVPFEAKSARRLRFCAALAGVGAPAWLALSTWADVVAIEAAGGRSRREFGFYFLHDLSSVMPWFLVAALFAVFAHAFTAGRQFADDSKGLV